MTKAIVLFDGICNLCNRSVQFIITHDQHNYFQFTSIQSETGKRLIQQYNISPKVDSVILIENNKAYIKSTAAIKIASRLDHYIKWLHIFIIIPSFIRNVVYDFIAKNRYRWFGKQEQCWLPDNQLKSKFLE